MLYDSISGTHPLTQLGNNGIFGDCFGLFIGASTRAPKRGFCHSLFIRPFSCDEFTVKFIRRSHKLSTWTAIDRWFGNWVLWSIAPNTFLTHSKKAVQVFVCQRKQLIILTSVLRCKCECWWISASAHSRHIEGKSTTHTVKHEVHKSLFTTISSDERRIG